MDSKHVEMIAHGLGSDMLSEIQDEVDSIESSLKDLSISINDLKPESQFALKRMNGYVDEAERISTSLFNFERRVGDLKRGPGVKDIVQLEENLKECDRMSERGRLQRELSHLKSIHSRKLSELVSNEQQLLQERLRLINIWKSILNYEIHILEECKKIFINQIVVSANTSGEASIIDMVRDRLRSLDVKDSEFSELKLDMSAIKVANIHVLHDTLNHQLNDLGKIENVVKNKRKIVQILNNISQEIKNQLPANVSADPMAACPQPGESQSMGSPVKVAPPPPGKHVRMAIRKGEK